MMYKTHYDSPLGGMLLSADEKGLTGLWFDGQKYFAYGLAESEACEEQENSILTDAKRWLDIYFSGNEPDFDLPLNPTGTDFQKRVWRALLNIPYGETRSYKEIAISLGNSNGTRAVAGAIGANGISIFIPCHRVIGSNHLLTGFAGGLDAKRRLLEIEAEQKQHKMLIFK